ncbi:MAG TPA: energy transducer TonB [Rhizomicrobium sp.]|nr:energy transducer TonB [Rhizomicrobium sp.]
MEQPEHLRLQSAQAAPRQLVSIGVVVAIHLVAIWAFATGLATKLIHQADQIIKVEVVKEPPPAAPKTPPPPPPELVKPPPPFVPPPDINLQVETPTTAPTVVTNTITPQPVQPKPAGVTSAALIANRGNNCAANYYPPIAVRLNHQGSVLVTVHIGADGSVQNVDVTDDGGFSELGPASVRCITDKYHFQPAMQNGSPVASTKQLKIVWRLQG